MSKPNPVVCGALFWLLLPACVSAQPRPGSFTTITTTDTTVTSLCVGANTISAPSSCLGGGQMGPLVVNQALTLPSFTPGTTTNKLYNVGGTLTWNGLAVAVGGAVGPGTLNAIARFTGANSIGDSIITQAGTVITIAGTLVSNVFGASSFTSGGVGDQSLTVRNTTAGVANRGVLFIGNDTSAFTGKLAANASTFTTSGADIANGVKLEGQGVGGLSLSANNAAGIIHFFTGTGTTERGQITAAGLWNWTTFGSHLFTAGGTGINSVTARNTTAGAGNSGQMIAMSDTVQTALIALSSTFTSSAPFVQGGSALYTDGVGGLSIAANHASGAVRIYTGGAVLRWGVNAAGDFTQGTTSNISDSVGTPTIAGGAGGAGVSIAGTDYAFVIVFGAAPSSTVTVTFGHTWTTAPICSASSIAVTTPVLTAAGLTTTSGVTIQLASGTAGQLLRVLCRSY